MPKPLVYAIDFGTSNSLLAASDGERVLDPLPLDPFASDPTILRSVLYFPNSKECHFGAKAVEEYLSRDLSGRLLRSIKRFLPVKSFVGTFIDERPVNLEDIVGRFLLEMRLRANAITGQDVESVVLGRPARFSADDEEDRYAEYRLERGARIAGFKHVEFCPEPVAAARNFRSELKESKIVFVGDFGGGTSDFTVVRLGPEDYKPSDVLAVGGVPVAGDALDGCVMRRRIVPHFGAEVRYKVPFGSNILTMPAHLVEKLCSPADLAVLRKQDQLQFFRNVQQWALEGEDRQRMDQLLLLVEEQLGFGIFEEIERVKRELSGQAAATFDFKYPGVAVKEKISKKQFEDYVGPVAEKISHEVDETLKRAGLDPSRVDLLCLTGGTAKVPLVQEALASRFGRDKLQQHENFHSVVKGLGERAREIAVS
jgi:hypothetical chaperone protein